MDKSSSSFDEAKDNFVFFGPVTKKEVITWMKHYGIYKQEYLLPMKNMLPDDELDKSLVNHYNKIIFGRPCSSVTANTSTSDNTDDSSILNSSEASESIAEENHEVSSAINCSSETESISDQESKRQTTGTDLLMNSNSPKSDNANNTSIINASDSYVEGINETSSVVSCHDSLTSSNYETESITDEISISYSNVQSNSLMDSNSAASHNVYNSSVSSCNDNSTTSEYEIKSVSDENSKNCSVSEISVFENEIELNVSSETEKGEVILRDSVDKENKDMVENFEMNCSLNDTLAEMNILLQGYNNSLINTEKLTNELNSEKCISVNESDIHTPVKPLLGLSKSAECIRKSKIPEIHSKKVSVFKKSPLYKDIVSPLKFYINNTPTIPLKKNVCKPTVFCPLFKNPNTVLEQPSPMSKAKCFLPKVTYKPANRKILINNEKEPVLPENVRKFIKTPLTPKIIKHEKRIKATSELLPESIPSNVPDQEVTVLSESSILMSNHENDISIHVVENAVKTNQLQKH